tara:strand:+ start:634 stop:903 length:270 start_codon:yes stop_codon:yes gene_type:complete
MKLITDNKNNILFKISKNINNNEIRYIIKNKIETNTHLDNTEFLAELDDIEYWSCKFDVWSPDLNTIYITGGNGLIELNIIEIDNIKEL